MIRRYFLMLLTMLLVSVSFGATLHESQILTAKDARVSRVELVLDEAVDVRVVDQIDAHGYFFIDLYQTKASFEDKIIPIDDGITKGIRVVSYPDLQVVRLIVYPEVSTKFRVADQLTTKVFDPSPLTATKLPEDRVKSEHIIIDLPRSKKIPFPDINPKSAIDIQERIRPMGKRLVVIDPGHGGKDPGAVSIKKINGKVLEEKDITLAIAREVARLLNKTPNVAAVMTRNSDVAMTLRERVDFAEKVDSELFISLHVNSTKYHNSKTAQGVEFYYFSEESKNEHRALVQAENAPGPDELSEETNARWKKIEKNLIKDILERNRTDSARAAEQFEKRFNMDAYFNEHNRGIRSAPFRVLMNMVSPALLIEVGFIDHPVEAQKLADSNFQKRIAKHIANGILAHFAQLDKDFEYYQFAKK